MPNRREFLSTCGAAASALCVAPSVLPATPVPVPTTLMRAFSVNIPGPIREWVEDNIAFDGEAYFSVVATSEDEARTTVAEMIQDRIFDGLESDEEFGIYWREQIAEFKSSEWCSVSDSGVEVASECPSPYITDNIGLQRRMGWRWEFDAECESCGLSDLGGDFDLWRLCQYCMRCPECSAGSECEHCGD